MDTINRFNIMHEIAVKSSKLGKTAMMKYLFLLQKVYKVPLGYNFEIYTYGPYSAEVMVDMDFAEFKDFISVEAKQHGRYIEYVIKPKVSPPAKESSKGYNDEIDELLQAFGEKTARDLELVTTIIYLYQNYKMNSWNCTQEAITNNVHEIKPYFNLEKINKEYEILEDQKVFERVV